MLKKTNGGWVVLSEEGKRLTRVYRTKKEAAERLKEIEFFKNERKS